MKKNKKEKNKRYGETVTNIKKTWSYVKYEKKTIILSLFLSLILSIIGAITPILSSKLILNITTSMSNKLILTAFFIMCIEILRNSLIAIWSCINDKYMIKVAFSIQKRLIEKTFSLKLEEIDKRNSGIFIERINYGTKSLINIFCRIFEILIDIATNIGIFISLFIISKIFFFYFLIKLIIMYLVDKKRQEKSIKLRKEKMEIREKVTGIIGESIRGIRDIKVLNIEDNFLKEVEGKILELNEGSHKIVKTDNLYRFITNNIEKILDFTFILLGSILINNTLLTMENFMIVYMYRNKVNFFTYDLLRIIDQIKDFNLTAGRIFEIIDGKDFEHEQFGKTKLKDVEGNLEFKNVNFKYNRGKPVIKKMSFKINPNETVAFVGKSGSGKSTIFNLIDKLYDIEEGNILLDGVNINELTRDSIRENISVITQNPYIFNLTIKENLKVIGENISDREIVRACKLACIHDFIMTLPEKYDTKLGEGGFILSGGERQRLAIARALLKKSKILLLDEATSALDNETQANIQKVIENMKGKCTVLIIAHRLSTVINSDKIFIIDKGKILGVGKHKDLIKENDFYKKLYGQELV